MEVLNNIKKQIREFHTKKPHIEFFTALLTIPVLLTVIILNLNNLRSDNKKDTGENKTIVITQPAAQEKEVIVTKEACKAGIGDITIDNPNEGDLISDNPVMIDINHNAGGYCEAVWSYRINNGTWSSYDDRSIALYNLQNGNIRLELRVKSVVNSQQKTMTRNFVYSGAAITPTTTPTNAPTPTP